MPNFHRFTIKAQEALQNAQEIAAKKNHGELKGLHLLAALLEDEQSLVVPVLERSGVNLEKLDEQIELELDRIPPILANSTVGQLYLSQELMKVLDQSAKDRGAAERRIRFVRTFASRAFGRSRAAQKAFWKNSACGARRHSASWRSFAAPCA